MESSNTCSCSQDIERLQYLVQINREKFSEQKRVNDDVAQELKVLRDRLTLLEQKAFALPGNISLTHYQSGLSEQKSA